jgi:hypothetical protein
VRTAKPLFTATVVESSSASPTASSTSVATSGDSGLESMRIKTAMHDIVIRTDELVETDEAQHKVGLIAMSHMLDDISCACLAFVGRKFNFRSHSAL